MHAVILAGGQGVRLRPYTTCLPKPLVPIGNTYSILEIVLNQLHACGFRSATLAIGHLGALIHAFVGDGSKWEVSIDYAEETSPLGTIGPILNILDRLPEHFLAMNGDILTDLDYAKLLNHHIQVGAPLTIATYEREIKIDFGVLEEAEFSGDIVSFREKPSIHYSVSMGVYGLSRQTLAAYPKDVPFGFDQLVLDLLERGTPPAGFKFKGYWLDIGRPDDYDRANAEFESLMPILMPERPRVASSLR